ncbi:MAG: YIP1 family protein [Candidatus Altiarchaeota archaeon]|nr:YIP1 family protein [Candidatus Altiarchaeota archaeon]
MDFKIIGDVLTKPAEAFKHIMKKTRLGEALKLYAVVIALVFFVRVILGTFFSIPLGLADDSFSLVTLLIAGIVTVPIYLIISFIFIAIGAGVLFLFARLLGGTGDYGQLLKLHVYIMTAMAPINMAISLIVPLSGVLGFFAGLYMLYLGIKSISISMNLSTARSIVVCIVPIVLLFLLAFTIIVIAIALFGSAVLTGIM